VRGALHRGEQARLPYPGIADQDDDRAEPGRRADAQRVGERRDLPLATDQRSHGRSPVAGPGREPGLAEESVQLDGSRLSTQDDRPAVVHRETTARGGDRGPVQEDLAGTGQRLHPGGGRDGLAGQPQVAATQPSAGRDDLASGDADAHLHGVADVARLPQGGPDPEAGEGRPDRVVIVGPWPAEDREHRIADELLARSAEALDDLGHGGKRGGHPRPDDLGIVLREHPDVVDEIGEQGRDHPAVTLDRLDGRADARVPRVARERRPTALAEARFLRYVGSARRTGHIPGLRIRRWSAPAAGPPGSRARSSSPRRSGRSP
jgi:hypothetical protein